jgi:ABC-type transport system substrate-binding protein
MFTDAGRETAELFVAFNLAAPPFDDPVAREIVSLAIDRQELATTIFDGLYEPAAGPINPASPLHAGEVEIPEPDLTRARELAAQYEAEHGAPLSFSLQSTPVTEYVAVVQAVQQQLAEIGVEVKVKTLEQGALIAAILGGNYEATGFLLFGSPHFDAEYQFLASEPLEPGQLALNFTRFDDAEVRDLMDEARTTADPDEQARLYAQVEERLRSELPMVFLVHTRTAFASVDGVHGANETTLPDGRPAAVLTTPFTAELWRS